MGYLHHSYPCPTSKAQGTSQKNGQEDCKKSEVREERGETVSSRHHMTDEPINSQQL